jgi:hypothetical protein
MDTGLYQVESQRLEHDRIFDELLRYVSMEALTQELHESEKGIFSRLMSLGLSLLKEVIARCGTGKTEQPVILPSGDQLPFHSLKNRWYQSVFGSLRIRRAYYWREGASQGAYPLDQRLNLPKAKFSYLLDQWTQGRIAEETYDEATSGLAELLGIPIWKQGQERVARDLNSEVDAFYQAKPAPDPSTEGPVLCATADCKGVPMVPGEQPKDQDEKKPHSSARRLKGEKRKQLRRDAVVTADYSFVPGPRTAEEVVDLLMRTVSEQERERQRLEKNRLREDGLPVPREPLNKQVRASMAGKDNALNLLVDRLLGRDPTAKSPIHVLIDGSIALEHAIQRVFEARGLSDRIDEITLDIMHAMEYLWKAGTALHGEGTPETTMWVRSRALQLLRGRVGYVIGGLQNTINRNRKTPLKKSKVKAIQGVITYFQNHRHMMAYDRCLRKGYAIATGVIEGCCGCIVKDRTDGSGMRWQKAGVQPVLDWRCMKRNGDWNVYWTDLIRKRKQQLYAFKIAA